MGRLVLGPKTHPKILNLSLLRTVRSWVLPALVAVIVVFGLHPGVKADPAPTTDELTTYLGSHNLSLGTDLVNGYQQVYYTYNGRQVYITTASYNHAYATASGAYVTWEGVYGDGGQIYMYNVLTKSEIRLSDRGTNSQPSIYKNTVVWRVWDGHYWQIDYYDGMTVRRITEGSNSAVRPSINGQKIIYAQQVAVNDWQAQAYDIASRQIITIRRGDEVSTAYPMFGDAAGITTAFTAY